MKNIEFSTCVEAENKIWFVTTGGYFMNYNPEMESAQIVFPNNLDEINFRFIENPMIYFKNKIYFLEQDGSLLYEYDIRANRCNYYSFSKKKSGIFNGFVGAHLFQNRIYLFGKRMGQIYYFDVNSKQFTEISKKDGKIVSYTKLYNDKIYAAVESAFFCYDPVTDQITERMNFHGEIIHSFAKDEDCVYLLTRSNKVLLWDMKNDKYQTIYQENSDKQVYGRILITRNKLFLLPCLGTHICVIAKKEKAAMLEAEPEDLKYSGRNWSKYHGFCENDKYIYCANRMANYFLAINKDTEKIEWKKMPESDKKSQLKYLNLKKSLNHTFNESEIDLNTFLIQLEAGNI